MLNTNSVLANFKYALLSDKDKRFQFIKDEEEVQRQIGEGGIKDGDVVIELTPETLRVASLKNYIELI